MKDNSTLLNRMANAFNDKENNENNLHTMLVEVVERQNIIMCYISKTNDFESVWNDIQDAFDNPAQKLHGFIGSPSDRAKIVKEVIDGYRAKAASGND